MFLVLKAAARAKGCGMWLGAKCSELQTRAEKRQLLRNDPRSAYPR